MSAGYTLVVDASTYAGSAALLRGPDVVAERSLPDSGIPARGQRGEDFMPIVIDCLEAEGVRAGDLARVVCGAGPGSFTSLRIAASIAKGIAVGAGCPLFAVSSLRLIAASAELRAGNYISVLPAMRGESFTMRVTVDEAGNVASTGGVALAATDSLADVATNAGTTLIGPGFGEDVRPHARGAAKMLTQILEDGAVDIDSWEPDYGRLAEAQVKWESAHGRALAVDE